MSKHTRIALAALTAALALAGLSAAGADGAVAPSRWSLTSHWGWNVNQTKVDAAAKGSPVTQQEKNVCTAISRNVCQPGEFAPLEEEPDAGGFFYPESVAVAPNGNVYVAEGSSTRRVQELTANGEFVLMFGWDVNKATVALGAGATQPEKDLCTEAEEKECQAGQPGTGLAGQLDGASAIAVDQTSGNVYVLEYGAGKDRVEEFTSTGGFVLAIGKEVNKNHTNLCTQAEESECRAGEPGTGQGAFEPLQSVGDLLAVGPVDHLLYVGDHNRVQELEASGKWVGEVPLSTTGAWVNALAVDTNGNVFVAEEPETEGHYPSGSNIPGVHEYTAGVLQQSCAIDPSSTDIQAVALDAYGRLGVLEGNYFQGGTLQGAVYRISGSECGTKLAGSEFGPLEGNEAPVTLAFNVSEPGEPLSDRMYLRQVGGNLPQEVLEYAPAHFPEALTCAPKEVTATSALLCGEIDPNGLPTIGFFVYGTEEGKLAQRTENVFEGEQDTFQAVSTDLLGLIPNQEYWYATAVEAQVGAGREVGQGSEVSFHTPTPAPEVPGVPVASFVTGQSVLFTAAVNPEHAVTRYHFEYGPCEKLEGCSVIHSTADQESSAARAIGVVQEARDLNPGESYSYRLVADNAFEYEAKQEGGQSTGEEGVAFTTPVIVPHATTGSYSALSATGAVISGEVDPDGKPASYAFELGVYNPVGTQYGIVRSGSAGEGTRAVGEQLALSGLQPGTAYAYRIKVESTYGTSYGEAVTFTTQGSPEVLPVPVTLAFLPVPGVAFPKEPVGVTPKALTRAQKLKNALKACKRERGRKRRAGCKRNARKRYGPMPKKKARKKK